MRLYYFLAYLVVYSVRLLTALSPSQDSQSVSDSATSAYSMTSILSRRLEGALVNLEMYFHFSGWQIIIQISFSNILCKIFFLNRSKLQHKEAARSSLTNLWGQFCHLKILVGYLKVLVYLASPPKPTPMQSSLGRPKKILVGDSPNCVMSQVFNG